MYRSDFMVNTVRAKVDWPLIHDDLIERDEWNISGKWKEIAVAWEDDPQEVEITFFAKHSILEIRVFGSNHRIHTVEAELPKLVHGCNGHLIRSQEELDTALETLLSCFAGFADTGNGYIDFRQVDLCLHFHCESPAAIIHAHRNCRLPKNEWREA